MKLTTRTHMAAINSWSCVHWRKKYAAPATTVNPISHAKNAMMPAVERTAGPVTSRQKTNAASKAMKDTIPMQNRSNAYTLTEGLYAVANPSRILSSPDTRQLRRL